jgi:hypothetical protein
MIKVTRPAAINFLRIDAPAMVDIIIVDHNGAAIGTARRRAWSVAGVANVDFNHRPRPVQAVPGGWGVRLDFAEIDSIRRDNSLGYLGVATA